jgi:mRNA interferase RelE/StbE
MYQVVFTPTAESDLAAVGKDAAQRTMKKLRWLTENFDALTPEPLTGQWSGMYKLRVGDYRVLYTFDRQSRVITVHFIRHRREVYRV